MPRMATELERVLDRALAALTTLNTRLEAAERATAEARREATEARLVWRNRYL